MISPTQPATVLWHDSPHRRHPLSPWVAEDSGAHWRNLVISSREEKPWSRLGHTCLTEWMGQQMEDYSDLCAYLKIPSSIWKSQSKLVWPPTEVSALQRGCWFLYKPEQIDFGISVWRNRNSALGWRVNVYLSTYIGFSMKFFITYHLGWYLTRHVLNLGTKLNHL